MITRHKIAHTLIVGGIVLIGGIVYIVNNSSLFVNDNPAVAALTSTVPAAEPPLGLTDFSLGQYYFNHGDQADGTYDLKQARHYYSQALRDDPKSNPLIWYQLGRIDFIEGKFDTALYKFDKQIEYFGDSIPNVYYMIGLTYAYKARANGDPEDWQRGAEGFSKFLEFRPTSPWARTDLTWIYFAQGKYQEMIAPLEVGLDYHPDNPWLLNMYGLALLNTDQTEQAKKVFLHAQTEAAKLTPADWGESYPGNNPVDWAQGLREFQEAINKNIVLLQ